VEPTHAEKFHYRLYPRRPFSVYTFYDRRISSENYAKGRDFRGRVVLVNDLRKVFNDPGAVFKKVLSQTSTIFLVFRAFGRKKGVKDTNDYIPLDLQNAQYFEMGDFFDTLRMDVEPGMVGVALQRSTGSDKLVKILGSSNLNMVAVFFKALVVVHDIFLNHGNERRFACARIPGRFIYDTGSRGMKKYPFFPQDPATLRVVNVQPEKVENLVYEENESEGQEKYVVEIAGKDLEYCLKDITVQFVYFDTSYELEVDMIDERCVKFKIPSLETGKKSPFSFCSFCL